MLLKSFTTQYNTPLYYKSDHYQTASGNLLDTKTDGYDVTIGGTRHTEYQVRGWRDRIKAGDNATTFLSGTQVRVKAKPGMVRRKFTVFGDPREVITDGHIIRANNPIDVDDVGTQIADNRAIVAFLGNCAKKRRLFQGGVFLGELRETLHLVRNPAVAIRRGLDDYIHLVRGGRWRNRNRVLRNSTYISDQWLEYVYGVKPLVHDLKDAAKAAVEIYTSRRAWKYVSHEPCRVEYDFGVTQKSESPGFFTNVKYSNQRTANATVKYRGVIELNTDVGGCRDLQSSLGFDVRDFVPTVWELIPYSFVVDYFTNIGGMLEALSTGTGGLRWYSRTTRRESKSSCFGAYFTPINNLISETLDPGSCEITASSVERITLSGLLLPQFEWRIPGFSSTKWLNLAALGRANYNRSDHNRTYRR